MDIFEGSGYELGNITSPYPLGPGNIGHGNYGVENLRDGNIGAPEYAVENFNKSKCSDSIFLSPHFREAAEKLRDQARKDFLKIWKAQFVDVDVDVNEDLEWVVKWKFR